MFRYGELSRKKRFHLGQTIPCHFHLKNVIYVSHCSLWYMFLGWHDSSPSKIDANFKEMLHTPPKGLHTINPQTCTVKFLECSGHREAFPKTASCLPGIVGSATGCERTSIHLGQESGSEGGWFLTFRQEVWHWTSRPLNYFSKVRLESKLLILAFWVGHLIQHPLNMCKWQNKELLKF